jgi:uncharacterized lipoprotein YddW (UPF0748 family)
VKIYGILAECQGGNNTLASRQGIAELFSRVSMAKLNTVFLQVYRGNRSWYDSDLADPSPHAKFLASEKIDPLSIAVQLAGKSGVELHAWINVFRVWDNKNARIIKRLGKKCVTKDSKGRSLLSYRRGELPDNGYWLEPGDPEVRRYLLKVIEEIIEKYPGIAGVHLDYVRYPYSPGSKIDFGFGEASVAAFKKKHSLDPAKPAPAGRRLWEDWKREQITHFIKEAHKITKRRGKKLSVAVVADYANAMGATFQDWPTWIKEGYVDFVVPMNYSSDMELVARRSRKLVSMVKDHNRVVMGLGAYKVLEKPRQLLKQINDCLKTGAGGIVLFSYDNMCKKPELFGLLGREKF